MHCKLDKTNRLHSLVSISVGDLASAQDIPKAATSDTNSSARLRPVAISDIADQVSQSAATIRAATRNAAPIGSIVAVENSLPQFAEGASALVAGLIGAASLSDFLLGGVLRSIYGATFVYATDAFFHGLLEALLQSRVGSAFSNEHLRLACNWRSRRVLIGWPWLRSLRWSSKPFVWTIHSPHLLRRS